MGSFIVGIRMMVSEEFLSRLAVLVLTTRLGEKLRLALRRRLSGLCEQVSVATSQREAAAE